MDLGLGSTLLPGDPRLIDHIVGEVKSQGIFDQFRKECIADVDTKPAYQNLRTRVESSVNTYLKKQKWKPDLNKNQVRESLRKQLTEASYLDTGVERIVDQVVNPKTYSVFMPKIEDVVYKFLGIEKPVRENNGTSEYKDLLPIDLDPVSPESDKNSLKDVSLDSVDANIKIKKQKEEEKDEEEEKLKPPGVEREKDEEEEEENKKEESIPVKIPEPSEILNNQADIVGEKSPQLETQLSITPVQPAPICPALNDSIKSEDKTEDDEDESPPFEPIESINFNESNDSHLSGISELTSHRSQSPDFSNDFSRDNTDFSNHDSQFSKVSSDSRLSIVTDFGSSNPVPTPVSDNFKDENSKDKLLVKDNFMEIREEMTGTEENNKSSKLKEINLEIKNENDNQNSKSNFSSKESSRDNGGDNGKEKLEVKERQHKSRDSSRSKSSNERSDSRESRHKDSRRKSSHSESKYDGKNKLKDKIDNSSEKLKEKSDAFVEKGKDVVGNKVKDDKLKEGNGRESKDLKDIYKEKIRELREKKELTEKANNDGKELKDDKIIVKDSRESKKDSSRDDKKHRRNHSSSHDGKSSRSSSKNSKSESKDRSKHDDRRHSGSRDSKKRNSSESSEKIDGKKSSKTDRDDKTKRHRNNSQSSSSKKRDKSDSEGRDKKRRDVKKSKSKDDHSSLRNNSTDRRSSDRDGSNGSNGKNSQKSTSSPGSGSSTKAVSSSSSSSKESSNAGNNSSSETSDGIEESQIDSHKTGDKLSQVPDDESKSDTRKIDIGQNEISLPLKKRPLQNDKDPGLATVPVKKPKFARNFQEAKKLMKIRKQMEREERKSQSPVENLKNQMTEEQINLDEKDKPIIDKKSKLSEMELSIRESLTEMISGDNLQEHGDKTADKLIQHEEKEENLIKEIEKNIASTSREHGQSKLSLKSNKNHKKDAEELEKLLETSGSLSDTSDNNYCPRKIELSEDEEEEEEEEEENVRYFIPDNSHLNKYRRFLKSLNLREFDGIEFAEIVEKKTMAPPKSKRKYSTSPLSDIFLNNSNNNNESDNLKIDEDDSTSTAKRKRTGRPKKQQQRGAITNQTTTMNGENFIMPLSPDSDVSATSDKMLSTNLVKEEKNRSRGSNQRYTSDDLYKPRPLFASSSKRSRRSNQA